MRDRLVHEFFVAAGSRRVYCAQCRSEIETAKAAKEVKAQQRRTEDENGNGDSDV